MKLIKTSSLGLGIFLSCCLVIAEEHPANSSDAKSPEPTTYQVRNQKYRELLRPRDANGANGTRLVLYPPQPWKCMTWRLQPAGEATFQVKNIFTSKTFAAEATTNQAHQAVIQVPMKKDAAEIPTWQFAKLEDGSYKITDAKSGKALTAVKDANDDEVKIAVEPWRNKDEQKWELQKIDPKQLTM